MVCSLGGTARFLSRLIEHTRPTTDNRTHFWTTDSRMHNIRAKYRITVIIRGRRQNKDEESLQEHVTRGRRRFGHSGWNEWQLYFPHGFGGVVCVHFLGGEGKSSA